MGFGFQIIEISPNSVACRMGSSRSVLLNAVENLCYEVPEGARSDVSIIFEGRIIMPLDGKRQIKIMQMLCR
jgi:hypothetical protein